MILWKLKINPYYEISPMDRKGTRMNYMIILIIKAISLLFTLEHFKSIAW
jgi:hypothetical protein